MSRFLWFNPSRKCKRASRKRGRKTRAMAYKIQRPRRSYRSKKLRKSIRRWLEISSPQKPDRRRKRLRRVESWRRLSWTYRKRPY
jgi:hypothetical protein